MNERGVGWGLVSVWIWGWDCEETVKSDNVSSSSLKVEIKVAY